MSTREEPDTRLLPTPEGYLAHLEFTRSGYLERVLSRYLAGFHPDYLGIDLTASLPPEDLAGLEEKMLREFERFELEEMELSPEMVKVAGCVGLARLSYRSVLRLKESGKLFLDRRTNLLIGFHDGSRWWITYKVTLKKEFSPLGEDKQDP